MEPIFWKVTLNSTRDPIEVLSKVTETICAEFTRTGPLEDELTLELISDEDEAGDDKPEFCAEEEIETTFSLSEFAKYSPIPATTRTAIVTPATAPTSHFFKLVSLLKNA